MGLKKTYRYKNELSGNRIRKSSAYNKSVKRRFILSGVKFARLKTAFAILTIAILFGGGLIGVASASIWLYGKAITSDFFTTTHIDIAGNNRLTRDMILQYGGISEGDNSLAVSISEVERNLKNTPWVKEVSVKRLLPDRFIIKIQERLPSFWIRKDNAIYYANERGEAIAPVESKNFLSLPTLTILPGAEDSIPCLAKIMEDIKNGALPIESDAISAINLGPVNGLEIFLEDRDLKLTIATDDWEGNLSRLGIALSDLAKRRELGFAREIRAVDGNVWVIRNSTYSS